MCFGCVCIKRFKCWTRANQFEAYSILIHSCLPCRCMPRTALLVYPNVEMLKCWMYNVQGYEWCLLLTIVFDSCGVEVYFFFLFRILFCLNLCVRSLNTLLHFLSIHFVNICFEFILPPVGKFCWNSNKICTKNGKIHRIKIFFLLQNYVCKDKVLVFFFFLSFRSFFSRLILLLTSFERAKH